MNRLGDSQPRRTKEEMEKDKLKQQGDSFKVDASTPEGQRAILARINTEMIPVHRLPYPLQRVIGRLQDQQLSALPVNEQIILEGTKLKNKIDRQVTVHFEIARQNVPIILGPHQTVDIAKLLEIKAVEVSPNYDATLLKHDPFVVVKHN